MGGSPKIGYCCAGSPSDRAFLQALAAYLERGSQSLETFEALFGVAKDSLIWLSDEVYLHPEALRQLINRDHLAARLSSLQEGKAMIWSTLLFTAYEYRMDEAVVLKRHSPFSNYLCIARIDHVRHRDCGGADTAMRGEYKEFERRLAKGANVRLVNAPIETSGGTLLVYDVRPY